MKPILFTTSRFFHCVCEYPITSVLSSIVLIFYKLIADSTVSWIADDTRILLGIKDEEDTPIPQNDLHKLYKWADTNNMKFNANKFELL